MHMSQKQNAKDDKSPYGPDRHHWRHALMIAWQHYYHLSKEQILDRKIVSHHKRVIRS
jgi:hypothetical protein